MLALDQEEDVMLRLRTILFVGFAIVSAIPVLMLAWWVNDSALEQEFKAVEEKHLLVAKNLTHALSRYARDVKEVFLLAEHHILKGEKSPSVELSRLFNSLHTVRICRLHPDGRVAIYHEVGDVTGGHPMTSQQLSKAKSLASNDQVIFLPVMLGSSGRPMITLVRQIDDGSLIIAEVLTSYVVELQKAITFGEKGHAAIVDQDGNVLAHPKPSWVATHKNIAKISPVKRMMAGEQGVSFFFSPALKADMVAGFSFVPETGWGAMIPQPVSELKIHAEKVTKIAFGITAAGLLLALAIAWWLAFFIARPTDEVARIARGFSSNKDGIVNASPPYLATKEVTDLVTCFNKMVAEVTQKTGELKFLANHDSLTGLPNRTKLKNHITSLTDQVVAEGTRFSVLFLDLDEFKEVNDTLGHGCGDLLLQQVAERLLQVVGTEGIVSRLGGDEFAIVLDPSDSHGRGEELSQRLVDLIAKPYQIGEEQILVGASVGIVRCPKDASDMDTLLSYADLAMYAAKADSEKSFYTYTAELHENLSLRKALEAELRQALVNEEFVLHYQPRVDIRSGDIVGFEALIRWQHPQRGLVMPNDFIAVSEHCGEIVQIGEWVIKQACIDQQYWREEGLGDVFVSINLSERQFHNSNLVESIDQIVSDHEVDPRYFEFEVTESLAMQKPNRTVQMLEALRTRGFKLSIDDFGTGYSSLERLKQLPIDKIKIDKSFSDAIGQDTGDSAIVKHIVSLSKGLSLGVVAEGIESVAQLDFLKTIDCFEVQGFIFSKAVPLDEATELLRNQPIGAKST